jgi:hypothetical protein
MISKANIKFPFDTIVTMLTLSLLIYTDPYGMGYPWAWG